MPNYQSAQGFAAQHPHGLYHSRLGAVAHLLLGALWLAFTGCAAVYHRTQQALPPDPAAQLTMRVEEARHAETFAAQAAAELRDDLSRHSNERTIQADLDRLELAARDLQRRTAAAWEFAASCKGHPAAVEDIDRLDLRAKAWLEYVQAARQSGPAAQAQRLANLLRGPTPPDGPASR